MKNLSTLRKEYTQSSLDIESVNRDPIVQFKKWMDESISTKIPEPSAMTLATTSKGGMPSSRIVLLKSIDEGKFIFYTNYQSQKGKELNENPACSLSFFWPDLERQIRIGGIAERVAPEVSDHYFQSRPRNSQVSAWASPQSIPVESREILEERIEVIERRYVNQEALPRPKQWGGYKIMPYMLEFWQGRTKRMHDRIIYTLKEEKWLINRLAP